MELNPNVCRSIAVQYGLPLQFVVKEFHVFNVLAQVSRFSSNTQHKLVFKGGTALNKVYLGTSQRFSEDLDFDLEKNPVVSPMVLSRKLAASMVDYQIREFRKVHDTIQFYCTYEALGSKDHVRVDIASKPILTSDPLQVRPAVSEFAHTSVSGFYVYSIEDLVARKIHALCTRAEGKDFYDVHSGLGLCRGMKHALRLMLKSENRKETPVQFLEKTIETVERADARKLRNLTNPFIPLPYRPKDWLELKNDLRMKLERLRDAL